MIKRKRRKYMVQVKEDLTGQRFGKLTVIKRVKDIYDSGIPKAAYLCRCDCGKERIYRQGSLRHGRAKTCGSSECRKGRRVIRNKYDLSGEYGIGYTQKGEEFYFDLEDYDKIKDYQWVTKDGYYETIAWNPSDGSQHNLRLHRLIMGVENIKDFNCQVDHINHNKADNRKENLRIVNNTQNSWNKPIWREDGSKVGVRLERSKWLASITVGGKMIRLGKYDNYNDAVKARIEAEKKYWGEYRYIENEKWENNFQYL
jgi:hypothetical protein